MDTKKAHGDGPRGSDPAEAKAPADGSTAEGAGLIFSSHLKLIELPTSVRTYILSTPPASTPTGELYREPESLDITFDETKRSTSEFNPADYRQVVEEEKRKREERAAAPNGEQPPEPEERTNPGVAPPAGAARVDSAPPSRTSIRPQVVVPKGCVTEGDTAKDSRDRTTVSVPRPPASGPAQGSGDAETPAEAVLERRLRASRRRNQMILGAGALVALLMFTLLKWTGGHHVSAEIGRPPLVTGAQAELPQRAPTEAAEHELQKSPPETRELQSPEPTGEVARVEGGGVGADVVEPAAVEPAAVEPAARETGRRAPKPTDSSSSHATGSAPEKGGEEMSPPSNPSSAKGRRINPWIRR